MFLKNYVDDLNILNQHHLNPVLPKETLLIPANLKSLILFNSKFVGFDSNVISIFLSKLKSLFINNKISSLILAVLKEGVPHSKN